MVEGSSRIGGTTAAEAVFLAAFATVDLDATARRPSALNVDAFRRRLAPDSVMMLLMSGSKCCLLHVVAETSALGLPDDLVNVAARGDPSLMRNGCAANASTVGPAAASRKTNRSRFIISADTIGLRWLEALANL